jgi:uncharacterized protein YjiS (DUF1127 family)
MTTCTHAPTAKAVSLRSPPPVLTEAFKALHRLAQRFDAWLATRKRASQDLDALARMSDRELTDIGLDRASVNFVGSGGRVRDYPF